LGKAGKQPKVIELLQRETEGNAFFLVEVVRALAEEAGRLDRVGDLALPENILTGGIEQVLDRRLHLVAPEDYPLLEFAAAAGRQVDRAILQTHNPHVNLDRWLTAGLSVAVFDVQEDRWRFSHEKLRERLLRNLSVERRRKVHRQVAQAIETVYPLSPVQVVPLTYQWHMAGDPVKELHYLILAADAAAYR